MFHTHKKSNFDYSGSDMVDIKFSDSNIDYSYKVLTHSGRTNIGKHPSYFHPKNQGLKRFGLIK
jgi:hypothetical protein